MSEIETLTKCELRVRGTTRVLKCLGAAVSDSCECCEICEICDNQNAGH
jgi:hypothetical protein